MTMINLFNINSHVIDTNKYSNLLHDGIVSEFENAIADYVGAKYAVTFNSATSAIFLALSNYKNLTIKIPTLIPPVVINAIITSGNRHDFVDNPNWVGDSYVLHNFGDYKIVDSAQKLEKNQFKKECEPNDLMIFSFYPTKPVGSCDGGMIVSDDLEKIAHLREMAMNGMSFSENNWERKIKFPGYKMYMNSIQCDIALRNFKLYEEKLRRLKEIRSIYNEALGYNNSSDHLYRIDVDNRDLLIQEGKSKGVTFGIHYHPAHQDPVYRIDGRGYPLSERSSKLTLSIPFHEALRNEDVEYVISMIKNFYKGQPPMS